MAVRYLDGARLRRSAAAAARWVGQRQENLNGINVFPVPDGDTGTNIAATLVSAVERAQRVRDRALGKVSRALADGALYGACGNSGAILAQFFEGFAEALEGSDRAGGPDLATAVRALRRVPSESGRLLTYREGKTVRELHADDINARFKELAGDDCSAKDLRTWNATVLAAAAFAEQEPPAGDRVLAHAEAEVMRRVAEELGNTPAVARASYVDSRVVAAYEQGRTVRAALRRAARSKSDDEARQQFVDIIELMGADDPRTAKYRKQLTARLY